MTERIPTTEEQWDDYVRAEEGAREDWRYMDRLIARLEDGMEPAS